MKRSLAAEKGARLAGGIAGRRVVSDLPLLLEARPATKVLVPGTARSTSREVFGWS
jgi:hypothetical protein